MCAWVLVKDKEGGHGGASKQASTQSANHEPSSRVSVQLPLTLAVPTTNQESGSTFYAGVSIRFLPLAIGQTRRSTRLEDHQASKQQAEELCCNHHGVTALSGITQESTRDCLIVASRRIRLALDRKNQE
ncbi:hypothetical protein E4U55_002032 [Claviceps digitariae]|nr:hypothetical protein E4U55_002032 [Claviceps digitariae]